MPVDVCATRWLLSGVRKIIITDQNGASVDAALVVKSGRLTLEVNSKQFSKPFYIDFLAGKAKHRREHGGGRGQLIARAVGVKSGKKPTVIDATAGWGQDAYVLASLGCKVLMIERSPIVAALLNDGLQRAVKDSSWKNIQLELVEADAINYLSELESDQKPDVVYLDPMFPERSKSAMVKKEMQLLQVLLGIEQDSSELLSIAMTVARKRVVVKRPKAAPSLTEVTPDLVISGKTSRYDIYLVKKLEL